MLRPTYVRTYAFNTRVLTRRQTLVGRRVGSRVWLPACPAVEDQQLQDLWMDRYTNENDGTYDKYADQGIGRNKAVCTFVRGRHIGLACERTYITLAWHPLTPSTRTLLYWKRLLPSPLPFLVHPFIHPSNVRSFFLRSNNLPLSLSPSRLFSSPLLSCLYHSFRIQGNQNRGTRVAPIVKKER